MDRKKELKEQYRQMKSEMGIFIIRSNFSNKYYIEESQNLRATLNSTKFKLEYGSHPCRELQKEWKEKGKESFTFKVLENLEYDKDETKTNYTEELALLKMQWEENLQKENMEFYKK